MPIIQNFAGGKADPRTQSGKETIPLGESIKGIDGLTIHEPKGARVSFDGEISDTAKKTMEKIHARPPRPDFLARAPHGADDIEAGAPLGD